MERKRIAVLLVPIPERVDVGAGVEILPVQGVSSTAGYLPLASPDAPIVPHPEDQVVVGDPPLVLCQEQMGVELGPEQVGPPG